VDRRNGNALRPPVAAFSISSSCKLEVAHELINAEFLKTGGTPDQFRAALARAIEKGWLERHESGTYVRFTQAGADLFAQMKPSTEAAPVLSGPILSSTSRPPSMKSRPCLGLFRQPDPSCRNDQPCNFVCGLHSRICHLTTCLSFAEVALN
jgi:hypothetical protein